MKKLIMLLIPLALLSGCVTIRVVDDRQAVKLQKDMRASFQQASKIINQNIRNIQELQVKVKDLETPPAFGPGK